ncbi:D-alanyl-D-alanine carboxypeptidase/D-alanyl-D-alanine-endopeptidase (penicillin-binding protein 4) [Mucilaginibacter lappiensis]|uniref:D-alanyl-D-alanine carboxypeptidase/D-alanyl-D-alanine-endopeptidase (Penicillin-binding protein 4) n=1 Tax=Mucilaginibacter lappiensis TaxID=354630 RepID=A0ABR6PJX0_9SPHI|nr:D-alanyl-D-alanine carboxypeptidase [Mucilaginibacter lappiensis]MBB6108526.1 D-alanyl-D-alanine carboxypeptidase/D-alanyl-D-alanine-endopeptidase (penicillin-binding protein 4) [Mucilaginibacter lappiensis]
MLKTTFVFLLMICGLLLFSDTIYAHTIKKRKIKRQFKHSLIMRDHFTGFALYDLDDQKMIYELNADKYFIPASNTKLFTFYTCLKMLGDSIPGLRYELRNDSLVFWGTGDPSFLHSDLKGTKGLDFLARSNKKLYYATTGYKNDFFGTGWAWGDYNDYYQAEITGFPIEDNVALIYADGNGNLQIKPSYLKRFLNSDTSYHPDKFKVKRDFLSNNFVYPAMPVPPNFRQETPWKTSTELTLELLRDTLKKPVWAVSIPLNATAKTIYNTSTRAVYKRMLQPSDNFIAEQLLLTCSSVKFNTLNTDSVISYAKTHFLNDLPDEPQWIDGSGLSRMNLFTPRSIIVLLQKIKNEVNNDQLLYSMLPAGGATGTLRNAYKTDNGQVFVWAKTGSLSNNYNQSGYLVTRKGKRLAFSFMNNNFTRPVKEIRDEMVRIMTYIHEQF